MVRLTVALPLLTLLLPASPAGAAPDLRADRAAMQSAMARVDCAGSAELLVGLADGATPPQPALDALGARVLASFAGTNSLLVAGDAGTVRWLAASPAVRTLHLLATARDREAEVLRRIAERDGSVRLIVTTLPEHTDAALAALGGDGVILHLRMATTPQATLELTAAALDRLLALPEVCGLAEDRLSLGN